MKPAAMGLPSGAPRRRRVRCAGAADGAGRKGEACGLSLLPAKEEGCGCNTAAAAGGGSKTGAMAGDACDCCC